MSNWKGWDEEQMAADVQSSKYDDGILKLEDREAPYYLRFLPSREDENHGPLLVTWQHFFEFPDGSKYGFNCPKMMKKEHCPGCAIVDKMLASGNKNDEKLAKRFKAKIRVLSRVILREQEQMGPRIFAFGKMIFDELTILRKNTQRGGDFTNPEDRGYDLEVLVSGKQMQREYKIYPLTKGPAGSPEQIQDWMDALPSLEKLASVPTQEQIQEGLRLDASLTAPRRAAPPAQPRAMNHATTRNIESQTAPAPAPAPAPQGQRGYRPPSSGESPF